ncbi:CMGC/CDK/CRK7 protein kinase [Kwoniella mangroviensis CBS 8886]|nr:CMGC/CDK/CRK7 protein kinase [Kwoniella mangroviensis CBS 8886]
MSDQAYSISRPLSPPMPSYEPLSANSANSISTSTSTSTAASYPRQPVKRESWRPGQPSSSSASAQGVNIPTGPAASTGPTHTNRWQDISAGPSGGYSRNTEGSRSPVSKRDISPSSSRGYEHSSRARSDYNDDADRDGDRDNRGWKRDNNNSNRKRKDFDSNNGNFNNNNNNYGQGHRFGNNNGGSAGGGGGGERSWAAWNQKVQNTTNRQDDLDRNNDRNRDRDRDRGWRRDMDRDRDRNRRRDDRDRDRDRRRSGGKGDSNSKNNDGSGDGRSWAAWKAKVGTQERERELVNTFDQRRNTNLDLETVKKEGFWTNSRYDNHQHQHQQRNTNLQRRDSPDYGNGSGSSSNRRNGRESPDHATGQRGRRDSPDYGTGGRAKSPDNTDPDSRPLASTSRNGRDSPDYGEPRVGGRASEPGGGRGARDSPDYGVGGKSQERSCQTSPEPNERKRAPSSPRANEPKRPRDRSPSGSRRGSPSPPPVNRWGRHDRQSPERRARSPPSGPRGQSQITPVSRRQPLAPQGDMFVSGGNNRPSWGERHEGPPQRRRGRDERMDVDETPRGSAAQADPSNEYTRQGEGYSHDAYRPTHGQRPFLPSSQPPLQQSHYNAKPPPPPSETLNYGSPPVRSTNTLPPFLQPPSQEPLISQDPNPAIPAQPPAASGPIKIAFNASPKKGWKSISPSKTIQNLFEAPTSPSHHSVSPSKGSTTSLSPTRRYSDNSSSAVAPYIQAAFSSWYDQGMSPPIESFLIHYFGREPSDFELNQIEMLLRNKQNQNQLGAVRSQDDDVRGRGVSPGNSRYARGRGQDQAVWRAERNNNSRDDDRYTRQRDDEMDRSGDHRHAPFGRERETNRRLSNSNGGVNDIPVIQSRWTPNKPTSSTASAPTATHGPIDTVDKVQTSTLSIPSSLPQPQSDQPSPFIQAQPSESSAENIQSTSEASFVPTTSGDMYVLVSHVGEGTYGKVYKARNTDTGRMVALKKIRLEGEKDGFPVTAMREIKLLQGVRQDNVVRLLEIMVSKGNVHMVFEYMEHDLTGLLSHPTLRFSQANIKSLNHQMLNGLSHLHSKSILHRDMKGSNILLNSKGELKLADFGLARLYSKKHLDDYTNRVITLWYRSPELLMGETVYKSEVDMWSAGCIVLEIFTTKPIFQGSDEINQLEVIYSIMGTPKESQWPGVKELPWYELVKPKEVIESKFKSAFEKWLSPAALQLVEGLLNFDPSKRLTAKDAMNTPYFVAEQPPMEMPTQLDNIGEHHEMSAKQDRQRRRQMEGR